MDLFDPSSPWNLMDPWDLFGLRGPWDPLDLFPEDPMDL